MLRGRSSASGSLRWSKVVAPDPAWPQWYGVLRDHVTAALGDRVLTIDHVGSTAVPGSGRSR